MLKLKKRPWWQFWRWFSKNKFDCIGIEFSTPAGIPCLVMPIKSWMNVLAVGYCEQFTQEELERAWNGNGIIKIGWVSGCGTVRFCVDRFGYTVKDFDKKRIENMFSNIKKRT
jgi:hypothetical protein